jgi:hypothetical protein
MTNYVLEHVQEASIFTYPYPFYPYLHKINNNKNLDFRGKKQKTQKSTDSRKATEQK